MSLTITDVKGAAGVSRGVLPDFKIVVKDVAADNAYPSGGYTLTPATFGMTTILAVITCPTPDGAHASWDPTTGKLKFLLTGAALSGKFAEASGAGVSGSSARIIVLGL
jgi:hypothetical protein